MKKYKLSGQPRRQYKCEFNDLRAHVRNFWYCHNLDKDMCSFYGGSERLMSDEDATLLFDQASARIAEMEFVLLDVI